MIITTDVKTHPATIPEPVLRKEKYQLNYKKQGRPKIDPISAQVNKAAELLNIEPDKLYRHLILAGMSTTIVMSALQFQNNHPKLEQIEEEVKAQMEYQTSVEQDILNGDESLSFVLSAGLDD